MNNRLNRSKLIIGTYCLASYARTERHIKELADCGIDVVIGMNDDKQTLDLFEKYGVKAMVHGIVPGWGGSGPDRSGKMHEHCTWDKYEAGTARFVDHPAICAIDVGDEPSALDFPYYGKVIDYVDDHFPNQLVYLNLYPNYASVAVNTADETVCQLGTATYDAHIAEYCRHIGLDYICYDHYVYSNSVSGAYENLRVVADAARDTGRSMWIVLQVNSLYPEKWITENQLRFQAYTAMAFGTEVITWACWTAGWWSNQVLDDQGEKTEQYEKLKTVNRELKALGETYMKYRRTASHFIGFSEDHPDMERLAYMPSASLSTGIFFDVKGEEPIVVGQMTGRDPADGYAIMIAAADDPQDKNNKSYSVTFRVNTTSGRVITAYQGEKSWTVIPDENGNCSIPMTSCAGVLVTAK